MDVCRCRWCNLNNPLYITYHDEEWGKPLYDDQKLYELLLLESFQAGLSWETILNKRENFRIAFDGFNPNRIASYDEVKMKQLMEDPGIIRNQRKISAAIENAKVFLSIQKEWGSFSAYLWNFTAGKTILENDKTHSPLSDMISADLKKQGMKFVGTTIIYSYLQAAGIIDSHEHECYLYKKTSE